jgi:CheY-like chemotaxis protein
MYRVVFEQHHFQVVMASDGQSALDAIEQAMPDVMLLDIVMPKVDGLEVLQQLKANAKWQKIPVVVTTSLTDTATADAALAAGATKFIQKSEYHPEEVVKIVKQVL